jgi:hypothetical protein
MEKRIGHRAMGKLAAAAAVGLVGFGSSQTADASLVIDIRATAVNGQPVSLAGNGDAPETLTIEGATNVVSFDIVARVTGTNDLDDEAFKIMNGVFRSNGGLLGDLSTQVAAPFNSTPGAQNGSQIDIDSDGDFDIGSIPNGGQANMFFAAFFGGTAAFQNGTVVPGSSPVSEEFVIGTGTWTAKGGSGETFLDFIRRRNPGNPGSNNTVYANWNEDGSAGSSSVRNGTSPYSVDGLNIVSGVIPEPTGVALAGLASLGLLGRRRNKNA